MQENLDKLDECEGRLSALLIDSATDESETNSPIEMTPPEDKEEVVYMSKTRKGTMRSKMVIDRIVEIKMKQGSKVTLRKAGETKADSEISIKAINSAKRKRVEEAMDMGQVDDRLPRTDKMLTDIAMVPPILMAGLKSAGYKIERSDRILTGATLEMEILSQCGESTLKDFKPSLMNHGKGSVVGQLVAVKSNRFTVSETVSVDEPAGGYMEMLEYGNSARGHLIALEDKSAMEGYLETMTHKAYGTLVLSEMHAETIKQLVSLPWRAVVLRYFEEEMRTTPKIHALIAITYVKTELQLRFAWGMTGLTRGECDSEERKRSKGEKVFLMTSVRDLITQEGAAVLKSAGYKIERSDRILTGATLEMEILSQCGESTLKDFKPSLMNHGKGSVVGQLVAVKYNRFTVSETVSVDEPAGGYMEMLEYGNSARGHLIALEDKSAMEGYLETMTHKAYGTLVLSEMHAETIKQLVSLPWRAVVLRYFEEEMRTTPKIHALIAITYVKTELQLRFAWGMTGLTRGECDSEERKRSKGEKVFLMTSVRDLITQEGAAVACAKRRDALFLIRFMIEQISVPALNTCGKILREGYERAKALLLLALLDIH